jgi:hypothetical protein
VFLNFLCLIRMAAVSSAVIGVICGGLLIRCFLECFTSRYRNLLHGGWFFGAFGESAEKRTDCGIRNDGDVEIGLLPFAPAKGRSFAGAKGDDWRNRG